MDLPTLISLFNGIVVPLLLALGAFLVRIDRRISKIERLIKKNNNHEG